MKQSELRRRLLQSAKSKGRVVRDAGTGKNILFKRVSKHGYEIKEL